MKILVCVGNRRTIFIAKSDVTAELPANFAYMLYDRLGMQEENLIKLSQVALILRF